MEERTVYCKIFKEKKYSQQSSDMIDSSLSNVKTTGNTIKLNNLQQLKSPDISIIENKGRNKTNIQQFQNGTFSNKFKQGQIIELRTTQIRWQTKCT